MANQNPVSFQDLFNFDDKTPIEQAVRIIDALSDTYKGMVSSVSKQNQELGKSLQETVKGFEKLEKSLTKGDNADGIRKDAKAVDDLNITYQSLKKQQAGYEKQVKDLQTELTRLKRSKKSLSDVQKAEAGSLSDLKSKLKAAEQEYRALGRTTDQAVKDKALNKIRVLGMNVKKAEQAIRDTKKGVQVAGGSYNELAKEVQKLNRDLKNLPDAFGKNRVEAEKLQKTIFQKTQTLKDFDKAVNQNYRNVGNYGDAFQQATPLLGSFGMQLSQIQMTLTQTKSSLIAFKDAQLGSSAATSASSKSLKLFRLALISTGIGAVVVALGALIAAFSSTQRGIDKVTSVTRPLAVLFQRIIGVVQQLSFSAVDSFSSIDKAVKSPMQALKELGQIIVENVLNRFKAVQVLGESVALILDGKFAEGAKKAGDAFIQMGTGITDGTDKIAGAAKSVGDFVSESIEQGKDLDKLIKEIEQREIDIVVPLAKARDEYEKLRAIAQDQEKSDKERVKALNEAEQVQRGIASKEQELIKLQIKRMELEQTFNDTSREEQKELQELKAQLFEKETEAQKKINSLVALRSGIQKKNAAEASKNADEALKANRELILAEEELQKLKLEGDIKDVEAELDREKITLEKRIELQKDAAQKRLEIAELEKEQALRAIDEKYEGEIGKQKQAQAEKLVELEKFSQKVEEIDRELKATIKIDIEIASLDPAVESAKKSIDRITVDAEAGMKAFKKKFEEAAEESGDSLETLGERWEKSKEKIFGASIKLVDELFAYEQQMNQRRIDALEQQKEYEIGLAGDNAEAKEAIEKRYNQKLKKLRQEQARDEKRQKTFSVITSTAQGIATALGSVPPPFNFILAGLVGAAAAVQLANIQSAPIPQFAKGTDNAPEGWAVVDEEGPEILERKGKRYIGQDKGPRLTYLERGDKVITAKRTSEILHSYEPKMADDVKHSYELGYQKIKEAAPRPLNEQNISQIFELNSQALINKLSKLEGTIKNQAVPFINIDEYGFSKGVASGINKVITRNNKYK